MGTFEVVAQKWAQTCIFLTQANGMQASIFYLWYLNNTFPYFDIDVCITGPLKWVTYKNQTICSKSDPLMVLKHLNDKRYFLYHVTHDILSLVFRKYAYVHTNEYFFILRGKSGFFVEHCNGFLHCSKVGPNNKISSSSCKNIDVLVVKVTTQSSQI